MYIRDELAPIVKQWAMMQITAAAEKVSSSDPVSQSSGMMAIKLLLELYEECEFAEGGLTNE